MIKILRDNIAVIKNASFLSIIEVLNLITPFIALPYILSVVGIDNYGKIAFARSIIAFVILLVNWGIDVYIVREVSVNRDDKKRLGHILFSVVGIKLTLLIISVLLLYILSFFIEFIQGENILMLCVLTDVLMHIFVPIWYFQGIEKMKYITVLRFVNIAIYLPLLFLFVKNSCHYWRIPIFQNIGILVSIIFSLYIIFYREKVVLSLPSVQFVRNIFVKSIPFFVSRLANTFNVYVAKLMTGTYLSMDTVGMLDIAQKIVSVAVLPTGMLNQAIYPHISRNRDIKELIFYKKAMISISIIVCTCVFILSPIAVQYFLKNGDIIETVKITRILCVYLIFACLSPFLGTSVLVSFGYENPFNISIVIASIFTIILYGIACILHIHTIELYASIICISEMVVFIVRYYYCKKFKLI